MKFLKISLVVVLALNAQIALGMGAGENTVSGGAAMDRAASLNELRELIQIGDYLSQAGLVDARLIGLLRLGLHWATNAPQVRQQLPGSTAENRGNETAADDDSAGNVFDRLRMGSIVYVGNYFAGIPTFRHYGVYIGGGNVIHFAAPDGQEIAFANAIIHETTLERFMNGRALRIDENVVNKFPSRVIARRARSRIGERGYSLLMNNCEHFARWAATGNSVSYQALDAPQTLVDTVSFVAASIDAFTRGLRRTFESGTKTGDPPL